jgi:hypothetical protein
MPLKEPDETDPMVLCGVGIPVNPSVGLRPMAETLVEEYARMGFTAEQILGFFRSPEYPLCNQALVELGEEFVREEIAAMCAAFSREFEV